MIEILKPAVGLFYMQVCADKDATDEEILAHCNAENPSGTSAGWCNVVRNDKRENLNPVVCHDNPDRLHFLVEC